MRRERVYMVHPSSVGNLAEAKAMAARYGASVVVSAFVLPGGVLVFDTSSMEWSPFS